MLNLTTAAVKVLLGRLSNKELEVYGRPDERRVINELKGSQAYQDDKARIASKVKAGSIWSGFILLENIYKCHFSIYKDPTL